MHVGALRGSGEAAVYPVDTDFKELLEGESGSRGERGKGQRQERGASGGSRWVSRDR